MAMVRSDLPFGLSESADVDAAIGAPMAAVEGDRYRSFRQQIFKSDETALLVRQQEGRHRIAHPGRGRAGTRFLQAFYECVDGGREARIGRPHCLSKRL